MVMTNAWKQAVLAEARATLARKPDLYVPRDEPLHYKTPEPDEPEPSYAPTLDTAPPYSDLNAHYLERRLEQQRVNMVAYITELLGECLGEGLSGAYQEFDKAIAAMRAEHQAALDLLRAEQQKEINGVREALNEMTIAVSRLVGPEQRKAALLSLAGMPVNSATN